MTKIRKASLAAEKKRNKKANDNPVRKDSGLEPAAYYATYPVRGLGKKADYMMAKAGNLPYNIPVAYSLEKEQSVLRGVVFRLKKCRRKHFRTDMEAIAGDWIKAGENLNESIRRYANQFETK